MHCRISYGIKINVAKKNNSRNTCKMKMHKTVVINEEVKKNIPVVLQFKEYKDTEPNLDKPAVNNLTKRFSELIVEVCKKAGMKYRGKNNNSKTTSHNWFDKEC